MSYARDLDEISTAELKAELADREAAKAKGLCAYCRRPPNSKPECKMRYMHEGKEESR